MELPSSSVPSPQLEVTGVVGGVFWWVLASRPEYTPLVYVLNTVRSVAREARQVVLDQRAVFSLLSLTKFWVGWDRSRKLFHGFSPLTLTRV